MISRDISKLQNAMALNTNVSTDISCIACGVKIQENSHSCKCGHVHETERKLIKGKRYSVYREQLYSKLTLQELDESDAKKHRSARKKRKSSDSDDSTQSHRGSMKKRVKKSKHSKRRRKQDGRRPRKAFGIAFPAARNSEKNYENFDDKYENLSSRWNFKFALDDINQRYSKQRLFWIRL
ncbi:uncharacterized protein LOC114530872 [Dendronephthya gigantea]|uniref:uncharacterized protein LOC114530872 n=1 Tax=Dendronephthya gigantea TaxID=151771 RepID=UPI00106C4024|nr:uncharacterized protein LOC114530872 [Dendronephthya gigantea]